jgi:hypothetical protein
MLMWAGPSGSLGHGPWALRRECITRDTEPGRRPVSEHVPDVVPPRADDRLRAARPLSPGRAATGYGRRIDDFADMG